MTKWQIEPNKKTLDEFLREFGDQLVLPSIQRQFVWDEENIRNLIDSIISGYPIGSIILWKTSHPYPCVPLQGKKLTKGARLYVLDGQQRLTALLLIKHGWKIARGDKVIERPQISYSQDDERLYVSSKRGIDVTKLFEAASGGLRTVRLLNEKHPGVESAVAVVGESLLRYQIPYYVIQAVEKTPENEYQGIADIFVRINSEGVKVGNLEMFLSFFASQFQGKHRDRVIEIHERLPADFELDLGVLLRFLFSRMGLSQNQITKVESFRKALGTLRKNHSDAEVEKIISRSGETISAVIAGLKSTIGNHIGNYLSSELMLLPLMHYCYESQKKPSAADWKAMVRWLLVGCFEGHLSTSANAKIERYFRLVGGNKTSFPLEAFSKLMKEKSGYDMIQKRWIVEDYAEFDAYRSSAKEYRMLLYTVLSLAKATDWDGNFLSNTANSLAVHHIFPQDALQGAGDYAREMINSVANLTVISTSRNAAYGARLPADYLPELNKTVLEQHCIPVNPKLWNLDRYPDFLRERAKLLWGRVKQGLAA